MGRLNRTWDAAAPDRYRSERPVCPGGGGRMDGWMEEGGGDEGQNKGENMRNRMEVNTDEKWGRGGVKTLNIKD